MQSPRALDQLPRAAWGQHWQIRPHLAGQGLDLYSRAKARFGFSDDFASKILDFVWRK
jgi:hypothetical protein